MKKFKLLGILFAVLMVFGLSRVNALSSSDQTLLNNIKTEVQKVVDAEIGAGQISISTTASGNTVTIALSGMLEMQFNVTLSNNIITYINSTGDSNETLALQYILTAISNLTSQGSNGASMMNGSYTFDENGLSVETSGGNITSLKVDAKNLKLAGGYTSSSSSTKTTTTTETTENPKTGVFVPVVGLSVLIIASVVCLVWISKKNVFKGL